MNWTIVFSMHCKCILLLNAWSYMTQTELHDMVLAVKNSPGNKYSRSDALGQVRFPGQLSEITVSPEWFMQLCM